MTSIRLEFPSLVSFLWLGATYVLADMDARFDETLSAELQDLEGDTHVGGLAPLLAYDSRDNLFTPTRGTYLLPYIPLRGVPIFRYQGEDAADLELEVRWQFWKRFSLVGFAGAGLTWNDFEHVDDQVSAFAGGTGFRCLGPAFLRRARVHWMASRLAR